MSSLHAFLLAAFVGGAGGSVTTTNLGHAVADWALEGELLAFTVDEEAAGGVDLNGDGDAVDHVVHVRDLATGQTTNLGLAATIADSRLEVAGGRVFFTVFEFLQGMTDLTGDGDAVDLVLHVHDPAAGTTTNTGLSLYLNRFRASPDVVAALVREFDQGFADLNGDGDTLDAVMHVVDPTTGAATNLGLTAYAEFPTDGGLVGFWVQEDDQGADLNGDGDTGDWVQHVHDATSGTTTNLGLAISGWTMAVGDGFVAFAVDEGEQGVTDLNGDGDTSDNVLQVYDAAADEVLSTRLAVSTGANPGTNFEIDDGRLAFRVSESKHYNRDQNDDGDKSDSVVHVADLPLGDPATNLAVSAWDVRLSGNLLVSRVSEGGQGATDLNGDGDTFDRVLHAHDLVAGTTQNLGLHVREDDVGYDIFGALVACQVQEIGQAAADLNGDGDPDDDVLVVHDVSAGTSTVVPRAIDRFQLLGPQVLLRVPELDQGADGNGDGDQSDWILELYDPGTDTLASLDLAIEAGPFPVTDTALVADGTRVAYGVNEADEGGTDLSGDGDALDVVLHVSEHSFNHGLAVEGVTISLAAGGTQPFALDAGTAHAGDFYWILGSISGTTPGLPGPPSIPLNPDAYFVLTLEHPEAVTSDAIGFLDATGGAAATLSLAPGSFPALAGLHLDHAAIAFDPLSGAFVWASNAVPLDLVP